MDFIRQIKGFQKKRRACPISAGAISLYLVLFETANDLPGRIPEEKDRGKGGKPV